MFQLNRLNNPSITLLENHGIYKISNADENLEEDHTFGYEHNRSSVEWEVNKLWTYTNSLPIKTVPISDFIEFIKHISSRYRDEEVQHARTC